MIRVDYHHLPVAKWTSEEAFHHLDETFTRAISERPDLMEPYLVKLAEAQTEEEGAAIMRQGLRETIKLRYPLKHSSN